MTTNKELHSLATRLGELLKHQGWFLTVAESCTGGWLAEAITSVAGSSAWFDRGFVTYSNHAKQEMLGVSLATLNEFGAVSSQTATEMAQGALTHSKAQGSIAITGIAGPDGGTTNKPVGTVWVAWAAIGKVTRASQYCFAGDRTAIRRQAVQCALEESIKNLA